MPGDGEGAALRDVDPGVNRTRHPLQGSTQGISELAFKDRKGEDFIFLHGHKNYTTEVENDQSLSVAHSRIVAVGDNEIATVDYDHTLTSPYGKIRTTAEAGEIEIAATFRLAENSLTLTPALIRALADVINTIRTAALGIDVGDAMDVAAVGVEAGGAVNSAAGGRLALMPAHP